GLIRIIRGGRLVERPLLDVRPWMLPLNPLYDERGLLGLAFSPDGDRLYVDYTDRAGDTRVVEYAVAGGRADPSSRRELLMVEQPFANHNGGQVVFGPDGLLYIGLGDGGSGGDPNDNGQRLDTLLGKILRIDPRASGDQPYTIPPDNPFVGREGARPEIWAYGLRNPWRFSFDRSTGALWIGDVGQGSREEISRADPASKGGENYGWNRFEGTRPFSGRAPANHVAPVFDYANGGGNCSVTGGYVYRGDRIPALRGRYLFADYCSGRLWALTEGAAGRWTMTTLLDSGLRVSSFGEDQDGELYVLDHGGAVYRIVPR
ncbi:MAG: PQQ-dependent sugar dehydrogenase, partial [Acidimicrobiales bacterium]